MVAVLSVDRAIFFNMVAVLSIDRAIFFTGRLLSIGPVICLHGSCPFKRASHFFYMVAVLSVDPAIFLHGSCPFNRASHLFIKINSKTTLQWHNIQIINILQIFQRKFILIQLHNLYNNLQSAKWYKKNDKLCRAKHAKIYM